MLARRRATARSLTLILFCMLSSTACFDIFGITDMVTGSEPAPNKADNRSSQAFAKSIEIVNPPTKLQVGTPRTLLAVVQDSNEQRILDAVTTWESSNTDIVSIDSEGIATIHRPGKVKITASFARLNDTFEVQVVDTVPHAIILDKKTFDVHELDLLTPTAIVKNRFNETLDTPVTWSADNTRLILFRKNGTILAKSPGKTKLHATAGDLKESIDVAIEPISSDEYRRKAAKLIPPTPEELATTTAQAVTTAATKLTTPPTQETPTP